MPQDSTLTESLMCWDFSQLTGGERYGVRMYNLHQVIYLYKFADGEFCVDVQDFYPGYYYITIKSMDVEETIVASFTVHE